MSIPGVLRIVGCGKMPIAVPDEEILALQTLMKTDFPHTIFNCLPIGTRVRVNSGPLTGIEGTVLLDDNERKLILSVHLLQRSVSVTLDRHTEVTVTRPRLQETGSRVTGRLPAGAFETPVGWAYPQLG